MSHEYGPRQHTPEHILSAEALMSNGVEQAGSLENFVLEIQAEHSKRFNGEAELLRLMRAAHFICQDHPGKFSEDARAFYFGELIGMQLSKHLFGQDIDVSTTINDTVQARIKAARPPLYFGTRNDPDDEIVPIYNEGCGREASGARLRYTGRKMLTELHGLKENLEPEYEPHERIIASITDGLEESKEGLVRAGYWLAVRQSMHPNVAKMLDEEFQVGASPTIPSLEELHEAISDLQDVTWDNITPVRNTILKTYIPLQMQFRELDQPDDLTRLAAKRYQEAQLNLLNRKHEFISTNDLLSISGNFFAIVAEEGEEAESKLITHDIEVRGMFSGIHIAEVPPNKELLRAVADPKRYRNDLNTSTFTAPVLRLINPSFTQYYGDSNAHDGLQILGATLDIPLIYKDMRIGRLKPLNTQLPIE